MAFTSTGQPGLVAPVSTFKEKMKCFLGAPSINASKKSDRDARSTTGVPMMPTGLMFPHGRPEVTGGPMSALPNHRAGNGVERINIIRFGDGNDHRAVWAALDVKRLRVNVAEDRAVKVQVADQICRVEGVNAGSI